MPDSRNKTDEPVAGAPLLPDRTSFSPQLSSSLHHSTLTARRPPLAMLGSDRRRFPLPTGAAPGPCAAAGGGGARLDVSSDCSPQNNIIWREDRGHLPCQPWGFTHGHQPVQRPQLRGRLPVVAAGRRLRRLEAVLNVLSASFFNSSDTILPEKYETYEERHRQRQAVVEGQRLRHPGEVEERHLLQLVVVVERLRLLVVELKMLSATFLQFCVGFVRLRQQISRTRSGTGSSWRWWRRT